MSHFDVCQQFNSLKNKMDCECLLSLNLCSVISQQRTYLSVTYKMRILLTLTGIYIKVQKQVLDLEI